MIVPALTNIAATFGLSQISVLRTLSGTFSARRIARTQTTAPIKIDLEMLDAIASDPTLQAGTFVPTQETGDTQTVMIVLRADVGSLDVLHLTLSASVTTQSLQLLASLAPALSSAWSKRQPGFAKALLAAQRRNTRRHDRTEDAPILSVNNSYGLSRSEFRVCRLLELGLRPREIAAELDLSVATIRTHLGNIYSKTELSGQLAVVSHLNGHRAEAVWAA